MIRNFLFSCFFSITLLGCATGAKPVFSGLSDPSIAKENHSVLYGTGGMQDVRVDGQLVAKGGGYSYIATSPIVLLPPGSHTITAWYYSQHEGSTTITRTETGIMSVEYAFESGHFNLLGLQSSGDQARLIVVDETDPFVWQSSQERGRAQLRVDKARKAVAELKR
jgi:hypothetical protein